MNPCCTHSLRNLKLLDGLGNAIVDRIQTTKDKLEVHMASRFDMLPLSIKKELWREKYGGAQSTIQPLVEGDDGFFEPAPQNYQVPVVNVTEYDDHQNREELKTYQTSKELRLFDIEKGVFSPWEEPAEKNKKLFDLNKKLLRYE